MQLNSRGRVVDSGWDEDGRVKRTRRDRTSASRIDFAVRLGGRESWVEYDPEWCEGLVLRGSLTRRWIFSAIMLCARWLPLLLQRMRCGGRSAS
eukprot:4311323-Prymnesium_polylepis.1